MLNTIEKLNYIKNYQEKIDKLLLDETINKIDPSYIINLFKSETKYRQLIFLKNPNFYKVISSEELYEYIKNSTSQAIYDFLQIENVIRHIKKTNDIGLLIEKIELKQLIKQLILKENIFIFLQEEYNYKPILLFKQDEEIQTYLKNKNIPENIKLYFEKNNKNELYDEEKNYLINHIKTKEVLDLLNNEQLKNMDLYTIYKKNIDKEELIKNERFQNNLKLEEIKQIVTEKNKKINKLLLELPIKEKLDGFIIYQIVKDNPLEYLKYLENEEISNKITEEVVSYILTNQNNIKNNIFILLTKNIVKNINIIKLKQKFKIKKQELDEIINQVNLSKYKKLLIKYDINDELKEEIKETLKNFKSSEIIKELKEEIKEEIDINIKPIMDFLHKNPDYEISNEYFEIILTKLFMQLLRKEYKEKNFRMKPLYDKEGERRTNEIILNSQSVNNSLNKNMFLFSVFFHELTHERQYTEMEKNNYNYESTKQLKDEILRDKIENYYEESYSFLSTETSAFIKGNIEAIKYFYENTKQIPNIEIIKEIKKIMENKNSSLRYVNGKKQNLIKLFDKYVSKEEKGKYIEIYPILSFEYNPDGTRRTLKEIENEYNRVEEELKNDKTKVKEYKFYKKLLEDLKSSQNISGKKVYKKRIIKNY